MIVLELMNQCCLWLFLTFWIQISLGNGIENYFSCAFFLKNCNVKLSENQLIILSNIKYFKDKISCVAYTICLGSPLIHCVQSIYKVATKSILI